MRQIKIGEKEYTLHYGQNAICALEDELDESISDIYARLGRQEVKLKDFRAILWAGLLKDKRDLTPEDVGDMCDEAKVKITSLLPDCISELNDSFKRFISEDDITEVSEDREKNG